MVESTGSSSDTFYCHNCGGLINRNSAFCTWCGVQMHPASPAQTPSVQPSSFPVEPVKVAPQPQSAPTTLYPSPVVIATDAPPRHSGIGIASCIIACVSFVALCATTVTCIISVDQDLDPTGVGALALLSIGLLLVGISTGIIGVVQSNRKKLFAILGLVSNTLMLLPIAIVLIIGLLLPN